MKKKNISSAKKDNVWSINGIPEMEYCSLSRASELLKCNVSDLLHFAEVRKIQLCIFPYGYKVTMMLPMAFMEINEWELFCKDIARKSLLGNPTVRDGSYSELEPMRNVDEKYDIEDEKNSYKRGAYLMGVWGINGVYRNIFHELQLYGKIQLKLSEVVFSEIDYIGEPGEFNYFAASSYEKKFPIDSENENENEESTLTTDDLFITKKQINKIYEGIGHELATGNTFNDYKKIKPIENEHHTIIKAKENRIKIHKAITKLFALYPHNPNDDSTNYRTSDGKLIISRISKCLDYHAARLFDDNELPIKDDSRLRHIISEYLDELGCKSE
ncbi:hypothetical protein AB7W56_17615 [Providencia rettgeri]